MIAPIHGAKTPNLDSRNSVVRLSVSGKFLKVGEKKFLVKGPTYGAFEPNEEKEEYNDLDKIRRDFSMMAANGMNSVRIPHTVPPISLLDIAQEEGLKVMVGLSAEQYIGYLVEGNKSENEIEKEIREKVRGLKQHPALLCYGLGNEIYANYVRWLGPKRVEKYLKRLYYAVKEEDPEGIVSYVNYPTTEYLDLSFVDMLCFNVYLESREKLESYIYRLQNIAGDRPLLMSEVGLDSMRNGEEKQADTLVWQLRSVFDKGCAGAFIFSWTDEWFRGGSYVDDWAFGLTRYDRSAKPALEEVKSIFGKVPFDSVEEWPKMSAVVCSYNGALTIAKCLDALQRLEYPGEHEVIVVNDGSTDDTPKIAEASGFKLISTENKGLSHARNVGFQAAEGEIVAYIDDDADADPQWLTYLAEAFMNSDHAAIGGPNIAPKGDGMIADCVANAPGGPVHVLTSDTLAEHIPGCNMAFRKSALESVGGFDHRYWTAGDDVDICWRILEAGATIGFCPSAMVWHHRRNSIKTYWKQQVGYGRAEGLLEEKWPEKYNNCGHVSWNGRIYGPDASTVFKGNQRVYYGVWGSAPFQSSQRLNYNWRLALIGTPEWWLFVFSLFCLGLLGWVWTPLKLTWPLTWIAALGPVVEALLSAKKNHFINSCPKTIQRVKMRALLAFLNFIQPIGRLYGRLKYGLTIWRRHIPARWTKPGTKKLALFTENWVAIEERLEAIKHEMKSAGAIVSYNSDYDRWDLQVSGSIFGSARMQMAIEDQGSGNQDVRTRSYRVTNPMTRAIGIGSLVLGIAASISSAWLAAIPLYLVTLFISYKGYIDSSSAHAIVLDAVSKTKFGETNISSEVEMNGSTIETLNPAVISD